MIVCRQFDDLPEVPLHLAVGVFDGVHIGHQAVIARAIEAAKTNGGLAGVLTFDPHPIRVIAPGKAPSSLLATVAHKANIIESLGADFFLTLHFNEELATEDAGVFLNRLLDAQVRTIAVGEDWRFGRDRQGDVGFLRDRANLHHFRLEAVPPVMLEGDRVSSTRIRQAIRDGNLPAAEQMLGRPYSVCGPVVLGRQLGRTLGFPTANVETGDAQLPPDGVWAVRVTLPDGVSANGVANLGMRPTVSGISKTFEVHLLDFSADLYGCQLEVAFQRLIRPERKFADLAGLKKQISIDVTEARRQND